MLQNLHIENYAHRETVDRVWDGSESSDRRDGQRQVDCGDALGLLLGDKGSPDLIRAGAERATVSGVFSVRRNLEELGFAGNGDDVVIRRELNASGKTRVFVNDRPATVGSLRALAPWLAEIFTDRTSSRSCFPAASAARDAGPRRASCHRTRGNGGGASTLAHGTGVAGIAEHAGAGQTATRRSVVVSERKKLNRSLQDRWETVDLEAEKRVLANAGRIHNAFRPLSESLYDAPGAACCLGGCALKALEDVATFDPLP